jgi:hypothetical protein
MWNLNNRLNLRLLDALTDAQLGAVILPWEKAVTSYSLTFTWLDFAGWKVVPAPWSRISKR